MVALLSLGALGLHVDEELGRGLGFGDGVGDVGDEIRRRTGSDQPPDDVGGIAHGAMMLIAGHAGAEGRIKIP